MYCKLSLYPLCRVSLFNSDNKMTSANLALVFGPTLTRAPPDVDPRQLHNDVPAVNMLIQLCIDHHLQVPGTYGYPCPASTCVCVCV